MKPDVDLQKNVLHALALDPHVDESAVGVSVRHGIVTLDGIVESYGERDAAVAAAHRVPGVHDVANELIVRPGWHTAPSDSEVAEAVRDALAHVPSIPHERIQTTVCGRGRVTLEGTVPTPAQRDAAEAAALAVGGVELVSNLLEVEAA
ncbi:MAG TPA: BON domain-containing protein [Kofleriaceae bacterium]|nr:BON domain-containing protein [Kofleriaceae bacterium]